MTMVRVRSATAADAAAIATLHAESWRTTYRGALRDAYLDGPVLVERHALWTERLGAPAGHQYVVVAEEGAEIVGFACAYGSDDEHFGTQLDNLHVRRDRQGTGTGARLVAAIAAWCATTHSDGGLYLWVVEQNHGARRFYDRLGGRDAGGGVWRPPDGSEVRVRRYAWTPADVVGLAAR
jgi:GNAT superfamily N-acetyltransferase